jgi:hypothetical protein
MPATSVKRSSSAHRIRATDSSGPSSLKRAASFQEEQRRAMTPPPSSVNLAGTFDPVSSSASTMKRANTLPSSSTFSFPVSSSSQAKSSSGGQQRSSSSISRSHSGYHEEEKQYASALAVDDEQQEQDERENRDDDYGEDVRYVESTEEDDHPHSQQQQHQHPHAQQSHGSSFLSAGGDLSPIPSFRNIPEPTANPINVRSDHSNVGHSHHHPHHPSGRERKTSFDSSVNTGGGGGGGVGPGTYIEDFNNHEVNIISVVYFFLSFLVLFFLLSLAT